MAVMVPPKGRRNPEKKSDPNAGQSHFKLKLPPLVRKRRRRFIEDDDATGLQPAVVPKVRRIISFLQDMEREEELRTVQIWKAHQLAGDRKGSWSPFVTTNWRITFRIDQTETEIIDPLGLSVTNAAHVLGVTRAALSAFLNGRAHLSPEMALRIEKAFGVSLDTVIRMQNSYDIAQVRKREGEIKVAPFKGKRLDPRSALI